MNWKSTITTTFAALALASCTLAFAQAAPAAQKPVAQTPAPQKPAAPVLTSPEPQVTNLNPFPPVNPKYFNSDVVTVETVNAFLKQLWGYDPNRIWQVAAIQKTEAPGITKVVVYVAQKGAAAKTTGTQFFVTPDGKHAIADAVISFGATPFADARKTLEAHADGPARGAASKDLLLVEFSDMQCPHCKEAQTTMDQLVKDFPNARVVYQNYPLVDIHPAAFKAAAYGVCVAKQNNDAFFQYAQAVFETQEALTPENTDMTLKNAVTRAGQNPATIAECADTQAVKDNVNASIKLAEALNVTATPTLYANGRPLPLTSIPYATLKEIISFQAVQDGVNTGAATGPIVIPAAGKAPSLK